MGHLLLRVWGVLGVFWVLGVGGCRVFEGYADYSIGIIGFMGLWVIFC